MAKQATRTTTSATPARQRAPVASGEARREIAPTVPAEPREPTESRSLTPSGGAPSPAPVGRRAPVVTTDMDTESELSRKHAATGRQDFAREDLEMPRLKLMQGISPELQQFDGLRAGHFLHTTTNAIFDEPFVGIPVAYDKRYILWRPREQGGGILARADDGIHWDVPNQEFRVKLDRKDGSAEVTWKTARTVEESGLARWGSQNPSVQGSPPAATLMYNYLIAFPYEPDLIPAVFTFQRISIKRGQKFASAIISGMSNRYAMFQLLFKFIPFMDKNGVGQEFWNVRTEGVGRIDEVRDPESFNYYRSMYDAYKSSGFKIKDIEGADDDAGVRDDALANDRPAY